MTMKKKLSDGVRVLMKVLKTLYVEECKVKTQS